MSVVTTTDPDQSELNLSDPQRFDQEEVDRFVAVLESSETWVTATEALQVLGIEVNENRRRKVRVWAENSDGWIISGQKGYRHIKRATPEEIANFFHWMESQVTKMTSRVLRSRKRAHQIVGKK